MRDTVESQRHRVEAIKAAGHRPILKRELGYATERCDVCGTLWPCPDIAQAREWRE